MIALSETDDQTVSELGEKLFLESNTLTPILKKLEQSGYISRVRDPADERQVRVNLTPAGRRLARQGDQHVGDRSRGARRRDFRSCRRAWSGCATTCCRTRAASRRGADAIAAVRARVTARAADQIVTGRYPHAVRPHFRHWTTHNSAPSCDGAGRARFARDVTHQDDRRDRPGLCGLGGLQRRGRLHRIRLRRHHVPVESIHRQPRRDLGRQSRRHLYLR